MLTLEFLKNRVNDEVYIIYNQEVTQFNQKKNKLETSKQKKEMLSQKEIIHSWLKLIKKGFTVYE